ncbi:unnamed protein product, partial [Laminaria digitata]
MRPPKVVAATVAAMGTLSTRKKADNSEGGTDGGGGESAWSASNGDAEQDSVEAKDTLFFKELGVKGQEWESNGRSFRPRHASPPAPAGRITAGDAAITNGTPRSKSSPAAASTTTTS